MKPGTFKRIRIPDSLDGTRCTATIECMAKMIREGSKDPLVIFTARKIATISTSGRCSKGSGRCLLQLKGIHAWCRANFEYVRDPVNVELIQTPNRMLRDLAIPNSIQKAIWKPIGKALGGRMPAPKMSGDADEATVLVLSLSAAIGIAPIRIRLGGSDGCIYTCWGAAKIDGKWKDIDVLHPRFGGHGKVELLEEVDVTL